MSDLAIQIESLGRDFDGAWAVRGLSLDVQRGEIFGVVGPDGAGKSTTMRMLAGILAPSEGRAMVAGHWIDTDPEGVKARIGYMSQRFGLYADLTVEENLRFYADLYEVSRAERLPAEERLLGFSNLTPFRKRLAGNLSGGMKQKLGLACALIHRPEVLLLDEPTNGVDPVSRRDFWRILYGMVQEGVTIFVSTAYLDEAERCTRVAMIHEGRLAACDAPARLKARMPGHMVEFEVEDPHTAKDVVTKALGAGHASLFGGRLHVWAEDESLAVQAERSLISAGIAIHRSERIAPSLEDVFVHQIAGSTTNV